jgi:predicted nucleic acid-binding Zn ribbon protein
MEKIHCTHCGKEIPKDGKFCSECGINILGITIPGTADKNMKKEKNKRFYSLWSGIFLLSYVISYYFAATSVTAGETGFVKKLVGALILALIICGALSMVFRFLKFFIRHYVWGILLLIIVAVPSIVYINAPSSNAFSDQDVILLQENFVEIAAAKIMGDSVMDKEPTSGASMVKVAGAVTAASKTVTDLNVPSSLKGYKQSAITWAEQIATTSKNTKNWKDIPSQPGDFPLTVSDAEAERLFQNSIGILAALKKEGHDLIVKRDRNAMRYVAAKALIQQHWLNGLLHSKAPGLFSMSLASHAFASTVPPVGSSGDVTCEVCGNPNVKWTAQLRAQYGCDTKCKPHQPVQAPIKQTGENEQTPPTSDKKEGEQPQDEQEIPYMYDEKISRTICIGTGGTSDRTNGAADSNKYCIEETIQSTNEIAASAIGFAQGESLTVTDWDEKFAKIESITLPEVSDVAGEEPSVPSAEGGHKDESAGITTGKPDAPIPTKKSPENGNQTSYPSIPVVPPPPEIDYSNFQRGYTDTSKPPPIDWNQDTSADQTDGSQRWQ